MVFMINKNRPGSHYTNHFTLFSEACRVFNLCPSTVCV